MTENADGYERPESALPFSSVIRKQLPNVPDEAFSHAPGLYSEAEAAYIMWHVFRTLRDRSFPVSPLSLVHTSQLCHLDIRPDNILLSSTGFDVSPFP